MTPQDTLRALRGFRELGSVLYVAAHPDDENTQLIAYLARGRGYRTAYLSLTRGDGGQNVIGPEIFEELGVIRTQELLAARRLDGGRQFFTRAIDFGFSKNPAETLRIWDRQAVVSDIVRVIRTFRPDVIITRFSPQGGGHGHHTASAILAVEAFKLAGDPAAFPVARSTIFRPGSPSGFSRMAADSAAVAAAVPVQSASRSAATTRFPASRSGRSPGAAARCTRARASATSPGGVGGRRRGRWPAHQLVHASGRRAGQKRHHGRRRHNLGPPERWGSNRQAGRRGGREIRFERPRREPPGLLAIRKQLASLPSSAADIVVSEKQQQLDRAIQGCLGLAVETTIPRAEVVPGEVLHMRHSATIASGEGIRWLSVSYPTTGERLDQPIDLAAGRPATRDLDQTLPAKTPLDHPYWLVDDHGVGLFTVNVGRLDRATRVSAGFPDRAPIPDWRPDSRDRRRPHSSRTSKGNRPAHWK